MKYEIKNWSQFQQYKDDRPLHWIKLHNSLLDDFSFNQLSESLQLQLLKLWLVASKNGGKFEGDDKWLAQLAKLKKVDINQLIASGFIIRTDLYENIQEIPREEKRDKSRVENRIVEKWLTPEWINKSAWGEWETHRSKVKSKEWSDSARTKAANKLKGFSDVEQQEAIDNSIEAGYPGLYPKKLNINGYGNGNNYEAAKNNHSKPESNLARFSRKIQADIAAEDPLE
jgi:hypothetical protein